jgi:hypothetical protein
MFQRCNDGSYAITLTEPESRAGESWLAITLRPEVERQLSGYPDGQPLAVWGRLNPSGQWIVVEKTGF